VAIKRVFRRRASVIDVESIVDHYVESAGAEVALGFIDVLEQAVAHIARHPGTGSPRYAQRLNIVGLRCWPLKRYPYLVFYFDAPDAVEIWRVLHGAADIPEWLDS
jgi:toxin ParE1/3/4